MKNTPTAEQITIPVGSRGNTSGILVRPAAAARDRAVIVAHGSGNNMNSPLLTTFSEGLAGEGYPVLRFNFLYMEHGRKAPDRPEVLMETWQAAYRFFREIMGPETASFVAAGKSLGGRMASMAAAEGSLAVEGLIFLGYPLHPAGDRERVRAAHLSRIGVPMLFFAGTRDTLCDLGILERVLGDLPAPWDLFIIEGGDHSFHVPKSQGEAEEEIFGRIVRKSADWLHAASGRGA